jgi:hypothetical protein
MKTTQIIYVLVALLMITSTAIAQTAKNKKQKSMKSKNMPTYVIERQIPEAGKLNAEQLQGISQKSCSVITELGPDIEWVHSYVTGDKIFCIYKAENEQILRTHAEKGGFPINSINKVSTIISPATATAALADIR